MDTQPGDKGLHIRYKTMCDWKSIGGTTAPVTVPRHLCMLTTRKFCVWTALARQKNTAEKALPHQPETDPGKTVDVSSRNGSRPH